MSRQNPRHHLRNVCVTYRLPAPLRYRLPVGPDGSSLLAGVSRKNLPGKGHFQEETPPLPG